MKRLLVVGLCVAGCGPKDAPSSMGMTTPGRDDVKVVGADPAGDLLQDWDGAIKPEATAGLYWLPYVTCWDCAPPAALVAYIAPDVATASAIRDAVDGKVRFGLPYVVHTDEIGASPRGIAVVTGAFGKREWAATAAEGSGAIAGVTPRVIEVNKDYWSEAPRHVTVIDRGPPTPAWSAADLRAVEEAMSESDDPDAQNTLESQHRWMEEHLAAKKPACTLAPGDMFVAEDSELEWYSFAPVRCGKELAYVPWKRSLLGHAVIVNEANGDHMLMQVVGAECDSPIIETWEYDENGRIERAKDRAADPKIAMGGC
jgi:hypothetical protein